jgi:hypothetical protein
MTLTDLDISSFNYPELNELKSKIETRMQDMRETVCQLCASGLSRRPRPWV